MVRAGREEARQGDLHGRVDHDSLRASRHEVGSCYSSLGELEQARSWYEQAVEHKRQGDLHGRVDHDSLGASRHEVGSCYSSLGEFEQARSWYEQAVEEARQGDLHGRVDRQTFARRFAPLRSDYASSDSQIWQRSSKLRPKFSAIRVLTSDRACVLMILTNPY